MDATNYVKVLVDGRSCNGGNFAWSLPRRMTDGSWQPGDWQEYQDSLGMCQSGFHLTNSPGTWMKGKEAAEVYATEHEGALRDENGEILVHDGEKIVCRRVRLIRALTRRELEAYNVFYSGDFIRQQIAGDLFLRGAGPFVLPDWLTVSGNLDLDGTGKIIQRTLRGRSFEHTGYQHNRPVRRALRGRFPQLDGD